MKRLFLTFAAVLATTGAFACTNLIVTKGASANGSNMCTYAADSHQLYGTLHYSAAADYPAGAMREIVDWDSGKKLGEIPQASHVYSVIGNHSHSGLRFTHLYSSGALQDRSRGYPADRQTGAAVWLCIRRRVFHSL